MTATGVTTLTATGVTAAALSGSATIASGWTAAATRLNHTLLALAVAAGKRRERRFPDPTELAAAEVLDPGEAALARDHPQRTADRIGEQRAWNTSIAAFGGCFVITVSLIAAAAAILR